MFGVESSDSLYLVTESGTMANGLEAQLEQFIARHPDTALIIIDTLQRIREIGGEQYSYAKDYEMIKLLKAFADKHFICFLIVHHTRKMEAEDSFDMISGTNGLLGAADGAFVLKKK
jgi:RecA-family ATPase